MPDQSFSEDWLEQKPDGAKDLPIYDGDRDEDNVPDLQNLRYVRGPDGAMILRDRATDLNPATRSGVGSVPKTPDTGLDQRLTS